MLGSKLKGTEMVPSLCDQTHPCFVFEKGQPVFWDYKHDKALAKSSVLEAAGSQR